MFDRQLKNGSVEILVLAPLKGRWVEKKGERRRCYYRLTARGKKILAAQRENWKAYTAAVNQVIGAQRA